MDKNTFAGLFLMLAIIVGSFYFMPSQDEITQEQRLQDSLAGRTTEQPVKNAATTDSDSTVTPVRPDSVSTAGPFGAARNGSEQLTSIENELIKVNISNKGGRVKSVELKGQKDYLGNPLVLFDGDENAFGLQFSAARVNVNTNDLYFTAPSQGFSVAESDSSAVNFRLDYGSGKYIDYIYSLKGNSFNVGFVIVTKGMQDVVAPAQKNINLTWISSLSQKEKDLSNEQRYSTAYFQNTEGDIDNLSKSDNDNEQLGASKWISFKQHFFSSSLIADKPFEKATVAVSLPKQPNTVKNFEANMDLAFSRQDINTYPMTFFFGPNKYSVLKDQGYGLEKQIDLGWGPMTWINRFIVLPVFNVLENFNLGYGAIILILTVLLKLVLSPLSYKSYVSMAKMRVLKPEMEEIKTKVGDDNPTLLQQEYLKLYKKAGVNPMGGCIPMLLQMPFTIAFFFFFPNLFELRGESFLWMNDLSTYDAVITFKPIFGIGHISLMVILMTLATLLSTWYNNSVSGVTGQMKYIGYIMPLIFLFVLNSFPSGLTYYYFLSTVFTFGQQFAIRQFIDDEKIHAKLQEHKKKPESKKKQSGFQKRMEDYMRTQQAKTAQTPKQQTPKKK